MHLVKTVESPCRTCENEHMNKEECATDCVRLHAFQNAILRHDEKNIKNFRFRFHAPDSALRQAR
jgi:hypothetical protein